jgi:hypothetical protein
MTDARQTRIAETLADALEPFLDGIDARDAAVRVAKVQAGIEEIPSTERALRDFVSRHLIPTLRGVADANRISHIDDEVGAIVAAVLALDQRPSMAPRPVSQLVLVASTRNDRVAQLEAHLGEKLTVQIIDDAASLDTIVMASVASAVVLDCEAFPVDAALVTHVAGSVGARRVLLWGLSPALEAQLAQGGGEVPVGCAPGTPMQHVAMLTKALVAGRHG